MKNFISIAASVMPSSCEIISPTWGYFYFVVRMQQNAINNNYYSANKIYFQISQKNSR